MRSYHWNYERTFINKVNLSHLIFDSNSTTYRVKYIILTNWLKLALWLKLNPSLPIDVYLSHIFFPSGLRDPIAAVLGWNNTTQ